MGMNQTNRVNQSQLERQQLLADIRSEIERRLTTMMVSTHILAYEVVRSQGRIRDFDSVAQGILEKIDGITNLQQAPKGVVMNIYPLKGHLEALGHNILGDKRRNAQAFAAVESGELTLAGPLTLVQGGVAVIARMPVYVFDGGVKNVSNRGDDTEEAPFWGFVSALIMLEDVLQSPSLASLANKGFSHKFSRFDASKNKTVDFAQRGKLSEAFSDKIDITFPNGKWTLAIGTDSAVGIGPSRFELALTLLFSFLLAASSPWLLKK
ncbi:MAG: CHASE domain-containing protein [Granulosicoccus sp.]